MEDQIIGIVCAMLLFGIIGIATYKKRRWGENSHDAKYSKGRR